MKSTRETQQKKIILEALSCADHPTAEELYEIIKKDNPRISRATVYRVLSQYSANGVINKLSLTGSSARFDAFISPHAHLHCLKCGRIFDIKDSGLDEVLGRKELGGFEIYASNIEFTGICKTCREDKIN